MNGVQIAQRAKEELTCLTGMKADTVTRMVKDEQGWHITVVLLEMHRIPISQDMLADYEVLLDEKGNLITYQRVRRYLRQQVMDEVGI